MPTNIEIIPPSNNNLIEKASDLKTANRELRLQTERARQQIAQELSTVEAAKKGAENTFEENNIDPAAVSTGTAQGLQFGAFCGLNIEFKHTAWKDSSRHGPNAKGKRYMEIFIRGNRINNDGTSSLNGAVYLPLYRNLYTDTLNRTYAYDDAWAGGSPEYYFYERSFWPAGQKPTYPIHFTGEGGAVIGLDQPFRGQYWINRSDPYFDQFSEPYTTNILKRAEVFETSYTMIVRDENGDATGLVYGEGWLQQAWNQREVRPTEEEKLNIRDMSLDMYHNGRESEFKINGVYADNVITGWENYNLDPVHEVFMLPYTKDLNFLLIIYTNLEYSVSVIKELTSQNTGEVTGRWPEMDSDNGRNFEPESDWLKRPGNTTQTYTEHNLNPIIKWPTGLDLLATDSENKNAFQMIDSHSAKIYSDFTTRYTLKINETGARQLQQIYLYKIQNGAVLEIDVPDQLREKAANLVTNLKGHGKTNTEGLDIWTTEPKWERREAYEGRYQTMDGIFTEKIGLFFSYRSSPTRLPTWWSTYRSAPTAKAFPLSNDSNETLGEYVHNSRKYNYGRTIDRSLPKGYGIGRLKYKNHFQQRYYRFQEVYSGKYKSFDNDNYFTPAVYGYLAGRAFPTAYYQTAQDALPIDRETFRPIVPNHYVTFPAAGEVTCEMTTKMPTSIHQGLGSSPFFTSTDVEEIRNCNHFCYNWNRPDVCWDELVDLGISKDLLGERPGNPLESSNTEESDPDE